MLSAHVDKNFIGLAETVSHNAAQSAADRKLLVKVESAQGGFQRDAARRLTELERQAQGQRRTREEAHAANYGHGVDAFAFFTNPLRSGFVKSPTEKAIDKINGDLYVDTNPFDEPRKLKDVVKALVEHLGVYFHPVEAHLKAEKYDTPTKVPAPRKKK